MKTICKFFGFFCLFLLLRISFLVSEYHLAQPAPPLPLIINTWHFKEANQVGWSILHENKEQNALKALVEGLTTCERLQCDGTVGFGGSPDEKGDTSLDAMIMDGKDQNMGAVAGMRNIKDAAKVAKYVLEHTEHSLLVGESATEFAEMMGFKKESLATKESLKKWFLWFSSSCQPNFWKNVLPNPKGFCGPYKPIETNQVSKVEDGFEYKKRKLDNRYYYNFGMQNHDTIGMIVVNNKGEFFAGTSTNGAIHKIPGRVGDSPIPGAGAYADNEVGAAVATGDGDIMMRFLPSALAVEYLRLGFEPEKAANYVMRRILSKYPQLSGAIVVVNKLGAYAAACAGMKQFPYSIVSGDPKAASRIQYKECLTPFTNRKNEKKRSENSCLQNELKLKAEINDLNLKIQEIESIEKCSNSGEENDEEEDLMAKSKEDHDVYKYFKEWKKSKQRK